MFRFKDFTIKVTKQATKQDDPAFEPLEETLIRMNAWIEENDITVLNVETVLLPNIYKNNSDRTSAIGAYKMMQDGLLQIDWWYQIYRVWYQ